MTTRTAWDSWRPRHQVMGVPGPNPRHGVYVAFGGRATWVGVPRADATLPPILPRHTLEAHPGVDDRALRVLRLVAMRGSSLSWWKAA